VGHEIAYVVVNIATFRANLLAVNSQQILADFSPETLLRITTKLHCVTIVITSQVLYFCFYRTKLKWYFEIVTANSVTGDLLSVIPLKGETVGPQILSSLFRAS